MAAVSPIQIVPLRTEARAPATTPNLTYRGGPVLSEVQVFALYWGDAWQQDPLAAMVPQLNSFFDFVLTSPLIDQLAEYSVPGMAISHGSRTGSLVLTTPPPPNLSDGDIQNLIQQELQSAPRCLSRRAAPFTSSFFRPASPSDSTAERRAPTSAVITATSAARSSTR